jgi:hypothetical protein
LNSKKQQWQIKFKVVIVKIKKECEKTKIHKEKKMEKEGEMKKKS